MPTPATPSQTVGPYFSIGLDYRHCHELCSPAAAGDHIRIAGRVFDGGGVPVPDAMLELWQADNMGRFAGLEVADGASTEAGFFGFARVPTDAQGGFYFDTVRPGAVPVLNGMQQAPHINVVVFMRGILKHLYTRIYLEGDSRNLEDSVLLAVPKDRRGTLCAVADVEQPGVYSWNIHLQGEKETVFFAY